MRELSIMVDESGEWGKLSKYYLITLVFHDQSEPVMPHIERYEQHLADASLPDIPFHAGPLLNGHADYETLSMADRKRLFVAFFTLAPESALHLRDVRTPQKRVRQRQTSFRGSAAARPRRTIC